MKTKTIPLKASPRWELMSVINWLQQQALKAGNPDPDMTKMVEIARDLAETYVPDTVERCSECQR